MTHPLPSSAPACTLHVGKNPLDSEPTDSALAVRFAMSDNKRHSEASRPEKPIPFAIKSIHCALQSWLYVFRGFTVIISRREWWIGREMASRDHMIDFACGLSSANLQEVPGKMQMFHTEWTARWWLAEEQQERGMIMQRQPQVR